MVFKLALGGTNAPGPDGLLEANQPWSGNYVVDKSIWANAHTTQFVQPGWQYLDTASAEVSGVGSYVSLKAPNSEELSCHSRNDGCQRTHDLHIR